MQSFSKFLDEIELSLDERADLLVFDLSLIEGSINKNLESGDDVVMNLPSGKRSHGTIIKIHGSMNLPSGERLHGTIIKFNGSMAEFKSDDGETSMVPVDKLKIDAEFESDKGETSMVPIDELKIDDKFFDGYWEVPLPTREEIDSKEKTLKNTYIYRFNVLGDGCGEDANRDNPCSCYPLGKTPTCYHVRISGDPNAAVMISFYRGDKVSDMKLTRNVKKKKADGSIEVIKLPVGPGVFTAVQRAVVEYAKKVKPVSMTWMPVGRTDINKTINKASIQRTAAQKAKFSSVTNSARKNVYETWSVKNFFPDLFVFVNGNWISRKTYDDKFLPEGFPPVPKTVMVPNRNRDGEIIKDEDGNKVYKQVDVLLDSDSFVKFKAFEEMNDKIEKMPDLRKKLERASDSVVNAGRGNTTSQRYQEPIPEERNSFDIGNELALNRDINPQDIRRNGFVRLKGEFNAFQTNFKNHAYKCFKVKYFYGRGNNLSIVLLPQKSPEKEELTIDWDPSLTSSIKDFDKVDSVQDHIKWYKDKIKEQKQIENIKFGEDNLVEGSIDERNPNNKYSGKVKSFSLQVERNGLPVLMVEINWDDKTTRNLYPSNVPYKANLFKKKSKDLEIDKKIDQQKRAEIKIETPSNLEAILSHPFNREKLKPGDHFVSSHFTLGDNKRGVITNMFIKNNILYATLRVLNAKSGPGVSKPVELPVPYISKDTSSIAAKARERISKDQQRQKAIKHGSGGLKVGDKVFVSSGQNSGKNGRIVSLKMSRGVISATVAPSEGQEFTTKLSNLIAVLSVSS